MGEKLSRHVHIALRVWPFIVGAFIVLGLMRAEQWLFPVIDAFSVTAVEHEPGGVMLRGHMIKARPCEFLAVTATSDSASKLALRFLDDDGPGTFSRPTGSQYWGPWEVLIPLAPVTNKITLTATHSCHLLWTTRTYLATVDIVRN